jgi:hypothetical protein
VTDATRPGMTMVIDGNNIEAARDQYLMLGTSLL